MTHLLIVDDNEQNRYLLQMLLTGHGYDVALAANGAEALDAARRSPPGMVISDVLMPVMDGFTLCREWRLDPQLQAIPFVFYTATYTDPQDEAFALSLGADRFIVKPVEPDDFVRLLQEVIAAHAAGQPAAPPPSPAPDEVYYKTYNQALIRKLEDKMLQLEERAAETTRQRDRLRLLHRIDQAILGTLALDQLLDQLAAGLMEALSVNRCSVWLLDDGGEFLRGRGYGLLPGEPEPETIQLSRREPLVARILSAGESIAVPDVTDPAFADIVNLHYVTAFHIKAFLAVPLGLKTRAIGFLVLDDPRAPRPFRPAEVRLAESVAAQAAIAIENARLFEQAEELQRRYLGIFNGVRDAIFVESMSGQILDVNDSACDMYGWSREQFLTKHVTDIVPPGQKILMADDLVGQNLPPLETLNIRANGDIFPIEITGKRQTLGDETVLLVVVRDITGRRRAEQEMRRRNRELTLLNRVIAATAGGLEPEAVLEVACREFALTFNTPHVSSALLSDNKTEVTVIAGRVTQAQTLLRKQVVAVAGEPMVQFLIATKTMLAVSDAQTDPRTAPLHTMLQRHGTASMLFAPLVFDGDVLGSLSVGTDERRVFLKQELELAHNAASQVASALARARLAHTRRRLTAAVEQTADSIIITGADGVIVYVNPAFEKITGYSRAEAVGRTPGMLKSGRQDEAFYAALWDTIAAGQVWQGRFENKRQDGALYTVETTITPVKDDEGRIVNYVAVQRDITRELELEEQYRQAQKMDALGQLTAGIAHDFNNILTAINGFAELAQMRLPPDSPVQGPVSHILQAGRRAADLVAQLLTFSRKQIIEPQVLDLAAVITRMSHMLRRIIGEDIHMETILPPDLWPVKVDPARIEQVIVNLAVNARDAMPEGGQLTIDLANVVLDDDYADRHLEAKPGEYVMLAVSDTGVGMSRETQARSFEPFFTTKETGKGTGLGLSTIFGIVKQSGGDIRVYSEEGQGSTFKIYLPVAAAEEVAAAESLRGGELRGGAETVLLVEDETAVRELASTVLRTQGYTVLQAADGAEALRVAGEYGAKIDLLLTDVIMPRMGGKELADRLVKARPGLKVLFTSGYTGNAIVHHGVLEPDLAFLQKPFSAVALARAVRQTLDE